MIKDNSMFEALIPRFPDYELIDSGDFEKLERFGRYVVRRPEPQAIWRRSLTEQEWRRLADASFLRDGRSEERGEWRLRSGMPSRWTVDYAYEGMRLRMRLGLTSFKHVGLFPEQAANWNFIYDNCVRMRAEERTPFDDPAHPLQTALLHILPRPGHDLFDRIHVGRIGSRRPGRERRSARIGKE